MGKKDSIKLSEKHGVNPTIVKCFFCGKDKGIAMLGKLPGDAAAPRSCIMDYEPCDECKKLWAEGQALVEVASHSLGDRPPITIQDDLSLYPTGRWCVIDKDSAAKLCADYFNAAPPPPDTPILMEDSAYESMFGDKYK